MGEDGDKLEVIFSCSPTSPRVYEASQFNKGSKYIKELNRITILSFTVLGDP